MEIFTLDTSCVLNLLNTHELVDQELVLLLRFGFIDAVKLVVTEQLSAEVIGNAGSQRPEIAQRIGILPVHSVSPQRCADRDLLAQNMFQKFWSNATPGSRNAEHGYRDCLHLASHKLCGGISDIQNHIKQEGFNAGCAMALRFGWWIPFTNPIPRSNFSQFGINGVPQHMQSISYQQYENIMKEGGIEW